MSKRYYLLVFTFALLSLTACSQSKSLIKKADAFFFVRLPGTIPVNPDGQNAVPIADTTFLVFVETRKADIRWKEAIIEGGVYDIIAEKQPGGLTILVTDKASRREIKMKPKAGHLLWRLTFRRKQHNQLSKKWNNGFLLRAESGRKEISIPIQRRREIILEQLPQ